MRVIKRFLFSFLFILSFSASIYGQYYTTQVDINYTKNYDMTAMSDVKLTIWVDNNNLCLLFDRFPETEHSHVRIIAALIQMLIRKADTMLFLL